MKKSTLTQNRLKELVRYDPETGIFSWIKPRGKKKLGNEAGCIEPTGYIMMYVDGHRIRAHRLAFLYMEGRLPKDEVDHIDGNKGNNRWNNLRHCNRSQNMLNINRVFTNKTGFKGVYVNGPGFQARISINGKLIALGTYPTAQEAHEVWFAAAKEAYGEFLKPD